MFLYWSGLSLRLNSRLGCESSLPIYLPIDGQFSVRHLLLAFGWRTCPEDTGGERGTSVWWIPLFCPLTWSLSVSGVPIRQRYVRPLSTGSFLLFHLIHRWHLPVVANSGVDCVGNLFMDWIENSERIVWEDSVLIVCETTVRVV